MTTPDLWPAVEPLLARVERPSRYIDGEWGAHHDESAGYRAVLAYPDAYEVGQANQALGILYERLNALEGVAAQRTYVPWVDLSGLLRERGVPLFSLESCAPVAEFDLIGITLPYELTYTNVLELLDLAGVPLRASERGEGSPLVVGGGPCAFNPEPIAPFFDAILIGEGEGAIEDIVQVHRAAKGEGVSRAVLLDRLAGIAGVYVPSLYAPVVDAGGRFSGMQSSGSAPSVVRKRVEPTLSEHPTPTCPVVPFMDVVHDRMTVEVLRGCTRGCRFCQAGMVYRPVRERSADEIVRDAIAGLTCTGYDEVSLTSLSTADHSTLEEVLRRLSRRLEGTGVSISVPSLRVDAFSVDMARLIASGKKTGLTFAPEAGTQRLRDVINKNVTEEDLLGTIEAAFSAGWRRVKLYFMLGLPTETDADLVGIADLVRKTLECARQATPADQRGSVRVAVSVSTFVPKAHTPFQWEPQVALAEVQRRQGVLRDHMPRKGVELSWHDAEVSLLEGVLARGGRELADVVEDAWRGGARFEAWTERFSLEPWRGSAQAHGLELAAIPTRGHSLDEALPWEHLSAGVAREYLRDERERAFAAATTPDCSFDGCTGCDVCRCA